MKRGTDSVYYGVGFVILIIFIILYKQYIYTTFYPTRSASIEQRNLNLIALAFGGVLALVFSSKLRTALWDRYA